MEQFTKQRIRKKQQDTHIKTTHDKDTEKMLKKALIIQKKHYQQFATKKQALQFLQRTYIIIAVGFVSSAFIYPISVRIVKKVFGFKTFFNIHFAILPIILNWNAVVLGTTQGIINYYHVRNNYFPSINKEYQ